MIMNKNFLALSLNIFGLFLDVDFKLYVYETFLY